MPAARIGRRNCVLNFVLNTVMGADPRSRYFCNRVKGELERDLRAVGFESLTFVRPGLISGERGEFRPGEKVAEVVLKAAGPVLPRKWQVNPARHIALAMLEAAVEDRAGERVVGSDELA